jgi:DNA-binding IclR family transcriptional regulator
MGEGIYSVGVLNKVFTIFNLFNRQEPALTLDEITKRSGVSKSTAFRLLKTCEKHGFLRYDKKEGGVYRLGLRFLELGGVAYSTTSVREQAAVHIDRLATTLGATILVGIIREDHLFYIDKRESESILRIPSFLGVGHPPYYGALGTVLFAFMDNNDQQRLLELFPPQKFTRKTETDISVISVRLDQIQENGYFVERGEFMEGVAGIAVPIRGQTGKVVAALGAFLPEFQAKETHVKEVLRDLQTASDAISREIGIPHF